MFVKICGITDVDAAQAAASAGADALGFVFAPSARRVSPQRACQLCERLPPSILRVAVMLHPTEAQWANVRDAFAPDWLQADAEDFGRLSLPEDCAPLPVYRSGGSSPKGWPPRLLFEGATSGSGETADWAEARAIAQTTQLILAGGLTPDNAARAIRQVRPWGVDVSSGVENAPGRKDPGKIETFIARARATENGQ